MIVVAVAGDGRLVLSVRDNGVGMAAPIVRGGGTGLAMVKKIAAQRRGRVEVVTAAGAGTCVSVSFALPPPVAAAGASAPHFREAGADLQANWQGDRQSSA